MTSLDKLREVKTSIEDLIRQVRGSKMIDPEFGIELYELDTVVETLFKTYQAAKF